MLAASGEEEDLGGSVVQLLDPGEPQAPRGTSAQRSEKEKDWVLTRLPWHLRRPARAADRWRSSVHGCPIARGRVEDEQARTDLSRILSVHVVYRLTSCCVGFWRGHVRLGEGRMWVGGKDDGLKSWAESSRKSTTLTTSPFPTHALSRRTAAGTG
jgi:hypothetical protein